MDRITVEHNDENRIVGIKRLGSTRKLLFNNIRLQLNEQLKCLDSRLESQITLIQELQDFFRRRGEVELDYSKSLDKLARTLQLRHKEQKQKRELWPMFSSYTCWQQLIQQTKCLSKDHATLADIYSTQLVVRLQTVIDDSQRIYKKCREVGYEIHEEILRVLQELHTTMKTYHNYLSDCKEAEKKLRAAENQKTKVQQNIPKEKLERNKKFKVIEKEVLKRKNKYRDARLKALKAKNEYQLCLESSNTQIHKYFVDDLSDLIDCMDLGFHSCMSRALLLHVSADQGRCRTILANSDVLSHIIHSMDSRSDKQKFLEQYHSAFMIPKRLEFQGQIEDQLHLHPPQNPPTITQTVELELQKEMSTDMDGRLTQLEQRVNNLRMESDEIWKTLETAEINLLEILNTKDYDVSGMFIGAGGTGSDNNSIHSFQMPTSQQHHLNSKIQGSPANIISQTNQKLRNDKQEIEEFYLTKIREFLLCTSRIARLDSKAEYLRNALTKDSSINAASLIKSNVPKRKRIGRMNNTGRKLFGSSLVDYIEATGEDIPLIIRSCIRVINLYGLHHQGIFRVSGPLAEITNFRESFERGDDPLSDTSDAADININSVAGVLKLYLRELREPLFPIMYFDHFIQLAQLESKHDLVVGIRKFLQNLPRSVVIVMRYLFAFLNHLSEYSDENMMDAYNLAICFGPTLMPAPEDKDQVQYQNQVNELVKSMIVYHEELFPKDIGGMKYEKYISSEPYEDIDVGDSPTEQITEDPDSEVYQSEDDSDTFEATALYDFKSRSERELTLRKGDHIQLFNQVSNDWWKGCVNGRIGLVPDKYISLKIKDEDRGDKSADHFLMKSSSSEESVRKHRSHSTSGHSQLTMSLLSTVTQQLSVSDTTTMDVCDNNVASSEQAASSFGDSDKVGTDKKESMDEMSHKLTTKHLTTKYAYHDDPHLFEVSTEYSTPNTSAIEIPDINENNVCPTVETTLVSKDAVVTVTDDSNDNEIHYTNSHFKFENNNKKPEPIYAEPTKSVHQRNKSSVSCNAAIGTVAEYQPLNIFQQNREKWQKIAAGEPAPQAAATNSVPGKHQSSILTGRNHLQPDLVMDLPLTNQESTTPPPLSISTSASSSLTSLDKVHSQVTDENEESMTLGEHFAKQNQCTLKKNEKFSDSSPNSKKLMSDVKTQDRSSSSSSKDSSVDDVVLRIEESTDAVTPERMSIDSSDSSASSSSSALKIELEKSPIPARNTQKFINQFADLKLTGGCTTKASTLTSVSTTTARPDKPEKEQSSLVSSFKPQVKVKPQLLLKKPSKFLHGHSMPSTSSSSSSASASNNSSSSQQQ